MIKFLYLVLFLFFYTGAKSQQDTELIWNESPDLYSRALTTFLDSTMQYPFPIVDNNTLFLGGTIALNQELPSIYKNIKIKYFINEKPKKAKTTVFLFEMRNEKELIVLDFHIRNEDFAKKNNLVFTDIGFVNVYYKYDCSLNKHTLYKLDYRINWMPH